MIRNRGSVLFLALVLALTLSSCSDDDPNRPPVDPLAKWVGEYESDSKWGGAAGEWEAGATLTITDDRKLYYGTELISDFSFEGNTLSWDATTKMPFAANITFVAEMASEYFWDDVGGSADGKLFTGWRQTPGSGPVDFRGVVSNLCWAGEYETAVRWGGTSAAWNPRPVLRRLENGMLIYGESMIVKPTIERNSVSWKAVDGNAGDATIIFRSSQVSENYWGDMGGNVDRKAFTGVWQTPGEGPISFRGLLVVE